MFRIESLLSARLFLAPHLVAEKIFFISNLSGRLSLYSIDYGGSVPVPLLPPELSLQNPHLVGGYSYYVFPKLDKILVMIDKDGDENYQPMFIPIEGGYPQPAFGDHFDNFRVHLGNCYPQDNTAYLVAESRLEPITSSYQAHLDTASLEKLGESRYGSFISGVHPDHNQAILIDNYTVGDHVLYLWEKATSERRLLFGKPIEDRIPGEEVAINAIQSCQFTPQDGLLFSTALFEDTYGLGYFKLSDPDQVHPVTINGTVHSGSGEFNSIDHLKDDKYLLEYNIDGVSWVYEGKFDEQNLSMDILTTVCGQGELSNGVLEAIHYDKENDRYAISFSTATSPTQIYTISGKDRTAIDQHTHERVLGISQELLSSGEEASFDSFDGTRVSARLYLPSEQLGFDGSRPLVYYVHGGPQSQERPDFAWFSMPLIQFLTMQGFAVFVPNVRGSTGYGLNYTKQVDRDWGGNDRLDHVHAMQEVLPKDDRLDTSRAGVVGRSYGGYMILTLAGRHPELWSAAIDMFGPYDLTSFMDRIPETWKPYFELAIGHPEKDRELLQDRSPRTHIHQIACPLLVIQGKNDPRVIEPESRDLVEDLRNQGKEVDYLMFEDEGHDVLKFTNRVTCYNAITDFFKKYLKP
ncbi:MAG: S9 family peptidase [Anaerolineales bacterium]|nr:S9 family peptidase [Anaerolineales bacterium]